MATVPLLDYNTRSTFDKLNPLIRSAYNNGSEFEQYKQNILKKVEIDASKGQSSLLNSIEDIRREQRRRLDQVESEYYRQRPLPEFEVPFYPEHIQAQTDLIGTRPALPITIRRSPSPLSFHEEPEIEYMQPIEHVPISRNHTCYHDDSFLNPQRRTSTEENNISLSPSKTEYVQNRIETMWNEFELEDYLEKRKTRRPPSAPVRSNWAGRVTVPEPFALTKSNKMNNIHQRKCIHEIEESKLKKEIAEELAMKRPFKAKPVPAHVRMPLYEQLREEQRLRRQDVHEMTKEHLNSISKPFGFEARAKERNFQRRHSFSGQPTPRQYPHFRAKPLPEFYYRTNKDIEHMKENSLYRSIKKQVRAKELLRRSRLPFSMEQRKQHERQRARSLSANDLNRVGLGDCTFQPKTNGYYVPDYDKIHAEFLRESEKAKKVRPSTKCEPFFLYTSLIPSKREQVLDDMRYEEESRHLQTFQIKGKQLGKKSTSGMDLSASLQQNEAIPTKMTESQRLREAIGKQKRQEHEAKTQFEERFQRTRLAREKKLKEKIRGHAKLRDHSERDKAKRQVNVRVIRESMRRSEEDYARKIDEIHSRVDRRPLLLEQDSTNKSVQDFEKEIRRAMQIAKITEKDLMRQKFNPPDVNVRRLPPSDRSYN